MARCAKNGEELGVDRVIIGGLEYCPKCAEEILKKDQEEKENERKRGEEDVKHEIDNLIIRANIRKEMQDKKLIEKKTQQNWQER